MIYPDGTRFLSYFYQLEGDKFVVRRNLVLPDGTRSLARHPAEAYKHLTNESEFKAFVNRLNHKDERDEKAKKAIEIKTAFIPVAYLEEFKERIEAEIPNAKDANYLLRLLHSRSLDLFVNVYRLPDPTSWAENQVKWGMYLQTIQLSAKTIRSIVQITNRFLQFLHQKNPREIPKIELKPISKARFKELDAKRLLNDDEHVGQYIKEAHWEIIREKLPPDIRPFVLLMYYYGLRRSESLTVRLEDIRTSHLSVERQYRSKELIGPLKGRTKRKTPHWMVIPETTYTIINSIEAQMHPDTLGYKWNAFINKIDMTYELHDLRRTFITRALDEQKAQAVQFAVGHTNITTTMKYQRDNRELEDAVFKPKGKTGI